MVKFLILGHDRFSYNNMRAMEYLNTQGIEYEYVNFKEYLERYDDFNDCVLLILDDDIPLRVYELDLTVLPNLSFAGSVYHKLKKVSNMGFYNNITNHFRCFSKWYVFNLLAYNNLPVPVSSGITKKNNLLEDYNIKNMTPPFFVRDMDTSSFRSTKGAKREFISTDLSDLDFFYNEHLKDTMDTFLVQEYIPHEEVITGHYLFGDIKFTVDIKDKKNNLSPLETILWKGDEATQKKYTSVIKTTSQRLKLNCFSVYFIGDKIINLKTPMRFKVVDSIFNIDSVSVLMENILNGTRRN